jgi:hypothetical protein
MGQQQREMTRIGKRSKEKKADPRKRGGKAAIQAKSSSLMERLKQLATNGFPEELSMKRA